jgi:hypothetical protein
MTCANAAVKAGVKRAVFGVNMTSSDNTSDMFESAANVLRAANVVYTIVKYAATTNMAESKYPYRIVRGELPIPSQGTMLANQDLYRVRHSRSKYW